MRNENGTEYSQRGTETQPVRGVRPDPSGSRPQVEPIRWLMLVVLLVLLVAALVLGVFFGSRPNSIGQVINVIVGRGDPYLSDVVSARVPRTIVGALVGAGLALSGLLIQTVTRNPLGEPGLLGISYGAQAAVVSAAAFLGMSTDRATVWVALPGAILAALVVYALGRRAGGESLVPLILAGAVVGAVLAAYVQAVVLSRPDVFNSFRFWIVGSLAGAKWQTLVDVGPALLIGLVLAMLVVPGLGALALGDSVAVSLGVPIAWVRAGSIGAATLLAAAATAAAGPIVFVGLAVPHIVRGLTRADLRWQVPYTVLVGAILLVLADLLGRVLLRPNGLMVGVITAFLGAPFLLAAVRRERRLM